MPPIDIHDIKPDVAVPWPWWAWAALVLLGLLILVGGFLLWRLRRRQVAETFVPRKNAVEEARERLEAARQLLLAGEVEAFYVAVSDAVRQYIERQFRLRAAEQTSEEFFLEMTRSPRLLPTHKELLTQFLTQCDLVKFARYRPGPTEMEGALAAAIRFVDETVPEAIELESGPAGGGSKSLPALTRKS